MRQNRESVPAMGSPSSWAQLKTKILEAIKKDSEPVVFEALLTEVRNYITELKRTS